MGSATFESVIFDMDGTLVEPLLDFGAIRAELGIAPGNGILEAVERMPSEERQRAERRLLDYELNAARQATPVDGAVATVGALQAAGLKTALLTRNHGQAMDIVLKRLGVRFDLAWSRQDGPIKPEPDGILRACHRLGVAVNRTVCVGDFRYDVLAANAAGAVSVLLVRGQRPDFADLADYVIARLDELVQLMTP
ncbi:MAG: HAD family hydrolase [Phycisphaerae bacterium]|nr:HAD family hydrolase [Phycisphaerae bacterium]